MKNLKNSTHSCPKSAVVKEKRYYYGHITASSWKNLSESDIYKARCHMTLDKNYDKINKY